MGVSHGSGDNDFGDVLTHDRLPRVTEGPLGRRIEFDDPAMTIYRHDAIQGSVQDCRVACFAFAQLPFRPLPLTDVKNAGVAANELPVGIPYRDGIYQH